MFSGKLLGILWYFTVKNTAKVNSVGFLNYIQVGCLLLHSASVLNKRALVPTPVWYVKRIKLGGQILEIISALFVFYFSLNDSLYIVYMIKLTENQYTEMNKKDNSPKNHQV